MWGLYSHTEARDFGKLSNPVHSSWASLVRKWLQKTEAKLAKDEPYFQPHPLTVGSPSTDPNGHVHQLRPCKMWIHSVRDTSACLNWKLVMSHPLMRCPLATYCGHLLVAKRVWKSEFLIPLSFPKASSTRHLTLHPLPQFHPIQCFKGAYKGACTPH